MRKELIFGIALAALMVAPCIAAVTVEETTDAEHLINQGFSQTFAEDVFVQKNRANGKPIEPLYEKSQNKFVKFCRAIFAYVDPAQETYDKLHHDIKDAPSFFDL